MINNTTLKKMCCWRQRQWWSWPRQRITYVYLTVKKKCVYKINEEKLKLKITLNETIVSKGVNLNVNQEGF